jgi:inorganic pyrophosphatase
MHIPSYQKFRPHPWHGIPVGTQPPKFVNAYIEITPFDGVKYEIDKATGYLKVDRPQITSSLPPALYGFIPQTFCAEKVGAMSGRKIQGDGDPLDIIVFSERNIQRPDVIVPARVIGGLRMIDRNQADDKIIAVLDNDPYWAHANDIKDLPKMLVDRLRHYFLSYKLIPGSKKQNPVKIDKIYGAKMAAKVIIASIEDYNSQI